MKPLVLLVDANPSELEALEAVLANQGYGLARAESALEAEALIGASSGEYMACLVDWDLPDTQAAEFISWIGAQESMSLEAVLIADDLVREHVAQGLEAGAYYFLTKPFEGEQLRAIVRAAIETSELRRELERKIEEAGEILRLLRNGSFRFRRPREAKLLAVQLGSSFRNPQVGVALFELLLNAVEHGNLEIDYDEKGRLIDEGRLQKEIGKRLESPDYRNRWGRLDIEHSESGFEILITDRGEGFDAARYLQFDKSRLFDSHGRGILMASATLEVEYLPRGIACGCTSRPSHLGNPPVRPELAPCTLRVPTGSR